MCVIWPDELETISDTKIFARHDGTRQLLVYQMNFDAKADIAMTLPVPVAQPARDDSLVFVNMEDNEGFFDVLKRIAPAPMKWGEGQSKGRGGTFLDGSDSVDVLEVIDLGDFIATFVPSQKDFDRIDDRFVLPKWFWQQNPQYADWGFSVVQLKKENRGKSRPHPIAFVFEKAEPQLFFPTLHLHGPEVEPEAHFDHSLFAQGVVITDTEPYDTSQHEAAAQTYSQLRSQKMVADRKRQRLNQEAAHLAQRMKHKPKPTAPDPFDEDTVDEVADPLMQKINAELAALADVSDDELAAARVAYEKERALMNETWLYNGLSAGRFVSYPSVRDRNHPAYLDNFKGYADLDARLCRWDVQGIAENGDTWVAAEATGPIIVDDEWGTSDAPTPGGFGNIKTDPGF